MKDEKPPAPTRGAAAKTASDETEATTAEDDEDDSSASLANLADLIPRTDIRYGQCASYFLDLAKSFPDPPIARYTIAVERIIVNAVHSLETSQKDNSSHYLCWCTVRSCEKYGSFLVTYV